MLGSLSSFRLLQLFSYFYEFIRLIRDYKYLDAFLKEAGSSLMMT